MAFPKAKDLTPVDALPPKPSGKKLSLFDKFLSPTTDRVLRQCPNKWHKITPPITRRDGEAMRSPAKRRGYRLALRVLPDQQPTGDPDAAMCDVYLSYIPTQGEEGEAHGLVG